MQVLVKLFEIISQAVLPTLNQLKHKIPGKLSVGNVFSSDTFHTVNLTLVILAGLSLSA